MYDWSFIDDSGPLFYYWLGWMLADGCIRDRGVKGISIKLAINSKDRHILKFFNDQISPHLEIKQYYNNLCERSWSLDRKYLNTLQRHGFVQNKTYLTNGLDMIMELPDHEYYQFMVGFIEGDGCVSIKKMRRKHYNYDMLTIGITSNPSVLDTINQKMISLNYKNRMTSSRIGNFAGDYRVCGSEAIRLYHELMKCKYKLLSRKWDIDIDNTSGSNVTEHVNLNEHISYMRHNNIGGSYTYNKIINEGRKPRHIHSRPWKKFNMTIKQFFELVRG